MAIINSIPSFKKFLILLIFSGLLNSCFAQRNQNSEAVAKRVLIIGLDGLSVQGFETAKTPNLDELFKDGSVSLNTRAVMPSITLPNWTSHLTSAGPEQHGITTNNWTLEDHELNSLEVDKDGYPISIFKILKDEINSFKTAYYYNWGNLINPINQKYIDEVSFLEDDAFIPNYKKAVTFLDENKANPSLVFLYTVSTDNAGHQYGWMSPEYITAIEEADKAVGNLIKDLKNKNLFNDTHFLLITDHGGFEKGHGGTKPVLMTVPWAIKGPGIKAQKMTEPNSNTDTGILILKLFGKENALPDSGIGKIPFSVFK